MCGIAGIFVTESGASVAYQEVDRMCRAIIHRGPDDQGIYVEENSIGLGMRRLSIIDVAGGHQPIFNEDGSICIVFNGEIYNFPKLKQDLISLGHQFRTNSDTEVIVHLYEEYGLDCTSKLRGMFAFAIFDKRKNSLVLARDRVGKKPLHYAVHQGRLLFGSEIKSILDIAPELAVINEFALLQFFYFGYIPESTSAFSPIHKLLPGSVLEYRNGKSEIRRYWTVPIGETALSSSSEEEILRDLEAKLEEAVRIRLISDVPLGAFLSGGVDSSTVVALMARINSGPVKTFSIDFDDTEFSEAKYARRVSQEFHTDHHDLTVTPDFSELLKMLSQHLEEPFADSSAVPTYYVSQLARKHVAVCLSGDGGDELFAGYDRYSVQQNRGGLNLLKGALGSIYRRLIFPNLPAGTTGRRYLYNLTLGDAERYLDSISYLPVKDRERDVFSVDYLAWADQQRSPVAEFLLHLEENSRKSPLSALQSMDFESYLPSDILVKVDRMSMANSLEVRAPLLDHVLIEWASQIPEEYRIRNGESKYILKKLAERIGVPKDAIYRRKQGFSMPLVRWIRNDLRQQFVDILTDKETAERGYFRPGALRRMLDEHLSEKRDHSGTLWQVLMFELWYRNFVERFKRTIRASRTVCV